MKGNIKYLCLQATREGQASYAHVHEIIKGLRQREWEVDLFQPSYHKTTLIPNPLSRLWQFIKVQICLWCCTKNNVDVLYIRSHFAAFPSVAWAKINKIITVLEINSPYEDLFLAWPWTRYFRFLFITLMRVQMSWANHLIVVTPQLKSWAIDEVGNKSVDIIPNAANINIFHPKATTNLRLPSHYVIFFGALSPWQGIETMLDAIKDPKWPTEVQLVLVGDGFERSRIEDAARSNSNIIYLGQKGYLEIPGIVTNAIAGLIPKNNKGERVKTGLSPLKLYETLACGVPVIITDFPGQADLVNNNNCGLVIPPEDPEALAKAVAYLNAHPQERKEMGSKGRQLIEQEHSWDKRASVTEEVLLNLLNRQ